MGVLPAVELADLKPKFRGWLHLGAAPVAVLAGMLLVVASPPHLRIAVAVYSVSTVLLFTSSAMLHVGSWGPRTHGVLRRIDHCGIFFLIAGSFTPFAAALLPPGTAATMLWLVWVGAVAGAMFRVFWLKAPRWVYTPVYLALGWTAAFFMPDIADGGGLAILVLLIAGGVCYSAGAVIYALRRPNPSPRWFGFHEVFHSLTLGGFATHWAAVAVVVFGVAAA